MNIEKYDKDGKLKTVNEKTKTKYDGGAPARLAEHLYGGGSIPQFCRNERICRNTLDAWCEKYPDMQQARIMGKIWAEGWWIQQAQENLLTHSSKEHGTDKFNTPLYTFMVGGRFGHTANSEFVELMKKLLKIQETNSPMQALTSAMAEEAEYTVDDNKTE